MTIEGNRADIRLWTVMRGIAALAVVLFHFQKHVAYRIIDVPLVGPVIRYGDMGVDMFFILSGFVMTYVYGLPEAGSRFDFRKFYIRRFARIYPVHFVTLVGAFVMLAAGHAIGMSPTGLSLLLLAVPVQLLLLHGVVPDTATTLNYPSWSVSSEMFAYLLFPFFAGLYRAVRTPLLVIVVAVVMVYVMMDATGLAAFGAIRVSVEFILGMGLCLMLLTYRHRGAGLAAMLLGFGIFVVTANIAGPRSIAIAGLAIAISGAFVGHREGPARHVTRALTYLGKISYSLYMVHALVEAPGFKIAQILTGVPQDRNPLWVLAVMVLISIAAAALLYHLIETPCRRVIVAYADRRITGARE